MLLRSQKEIQVEPVYKTKKYSNKELRINFAKKKR